MAKEVRKPCYLCNMALYEDARPIYLLARNLFPKAHYTVTIHHIYDNIKLYTITVDLYASQFIKLAYLNKIKKGQELCQKNQK